MNIHTSHHIAHVLLSSLGWLEWSLLSGLGVSSFRCELDPPSWPTKEWKKLNDIKHIINIKDCYIDGNNMKPTWDMYLSYRRQPKWRWWGAEQRTVTYQILVALSYAIHVIMQKTSTKIMPKCSISCNEITYLTWSIAYYCAKQAA
jgi:hypothetical protein